MPGKKDSLIVGFHSKIECKSFNGCGPTFFDMIGTGHKGSNVREVPAQLFVETLAKHLEKTGLIKAPEWSDLVKTASFKEMPPNNNNWFYIRAASIARQVYLNPHTSVESLRNRYGGKVDYGHCPSHHGKCSGKVIRSCLAQLKKIEWIQETDEGCVITKKGQKQLDVLSQEIAKSRTQE